MSRKQFVRIIIIVISVYLIVTTVRSMVDLWNAGDKLTKRQQTLAVLQQEQQRLLERKAKVESEEYLEKVARDELGLSREGEETILIPAELLAAPAPKAYDLQAPYWQQWASLFW